MQQILFSGQGRISLHTRIAGIAQAGLLIGNSPDFKLTLNTTTEDHIESQSGNRLNDGRLQKANKAGVSFSLENFVKENLALALYGTATSQGTGMVTSEALPAAALIDELFILAHQNISSVVVKDSTGVPKTLTAGQYTANLKHGSIVLSDILTGAPFVQPFKVDYSYADATQVSIFTQTIPERWLRFEGINTADNNNAFTVDIYRVALDPIASFDFLNDSFAKFPMSGSALVDTTKPSTGALGQFGRIITY